jgi:hypothetical protein
MNSKGRSQVYFQNCLGHEIENASISLHAEMSKTHSEYYFHFRVTRVFLWGIWRSLFSEGIPNLSESFGFFGRDAAPEGQEPLEGEMS